MAASGSQRGERGGRKIWFDSFQEFASEDFIPAASKSNIFAGGKKRWPPPLGGSLHV